MVQRFHDHVRQTLAAAGVAAADAVVVACSYGPDSLALADAVIALGYDCTLVYVDHGLRPEAAREGHAVADFAAAHGKRSHVVQVRLDRRRGGGLEEAARAARYAALEAVAQGAWILVGHTASDQAETVLSRLLRGAGVVGLAGIPAVRGRIVRPLLQLHRADIDAYLAARALTAADDASNESPVFARNRIRHQILPILRGENPAVDAALVRTASSMREMAEALDWAVDRALAEVGHRNGRLDAPALAALPPAIAKRLLTRLAAKHGAQLEADHLEAALRLASETAGTKSLSLPKLTLRREYAELVLALRR